MAWVFLINISGQRKQVELSEDRPLLPEKPHLIEMAVILCHFSYSY